MFEDVAKSLAERESDSNRHQFSEDEINSLRERYPDIPSDYLAYLREIGGGAFLDCRYTVYGGFNSPDFYWGHGTEEALGKPVLCFGDDFAGYVAAFLPDEEWAVVELNSSGTGMDYLGIPFAQFVRQHMDMDA